MSTNQDLYFFGGGEAEGQGGMKDILGGKGAGLAEMTNAGVPVPPGFTIATMVCLEFFKEGGKVPDRVRKAQEAYLRRLEELMGERLGDPENPLLLSLRSGAKCSISGMMDTVLNLGINDRSVEGLIKNTGNPRFGWDCYRRFISMFGNVVLEIPKRRFEDELERVKHETKAGTDA